MKTIKISDEMYDSLMEISKELNTQNHRATAMPYFFQIQTKEEISVGEGQGEEIWAFDGSVLENEEEIQEVVIQHQEWEDDEAKQLFSELSFYDINEILESAGYIQHNRDFEKRYQNAFFTEKACKLHIKQNYYHYNNPVDYLSYASRNPEMELVMRFLCELSSGELHK